MGYMYNERLFQFLYGSAYVPMAVLMFFVWPVSQDVYSA